MRTHVGEPSGNCDSRDLHKPDCVPDEEPVAKLLKWYHRCQFGSVSSATICIAVSACLIIQPDWLAPVILVPAWCWLSSGLLLAIAGFCRNQKRRFAVILLLWAVFAGLFVEEARSLFRVQSLSPPEWRAFHESGVGIRVVSLNCNVGQARCVEEVKAWMPDVVLLQESPGSRQLESLAETLFGPEGTFLYGGDVSILTRGELRPRHVDPASHFVHAEVVSSSGVVAEVVSVRLAPPVPRLDFWTPGFWSDHREKRIEHREQVLELVQSVQNIPAANRLIVGGDFNSPPNDDALASLRPLLSDTFKSAGRGWGATGTNEYPLFRVDQVWVSNGFRAESVIAQKTHFSDHRMVVCDLIVEK